MTRLCRRCLQERPIKWFPLSPSCEGGRRFTCRACAGAVGRGRDPVEVQVRFLAKVERRGTDECWPWMAHTDKDGYGTLEVGNASQRAHRVAYELLCGQVPPGIWVLHHCDNPPCCNPKHLFLGTNQDNVDDKLAKGRGPDFRGEKHPSARLSVADIHAIREQRRNGITQREVARRWKISQGHVSEITTGKKWGHVQ